MALSRSCRVLLLEPERSITTGQPRSSEKASSEILQRRWRRGADESNWGNLVPPTHRSTCPIGTREVPATARHARKYTHDTMCDDAYDAESAFPTLTAGGCATGTGLTGCAHHRVLQRWRRWGSKVTNNDCRCRRPHTDPLTDSDILANPEGQRGLGRAGWWYGHVPCNGLCKPRVGSFFFFVFLSRVRGNG